MPDSNYNIKIDTSAGPSPQDNSVEAILKRVNVNIPQSGEGLTPADSAPKPIPNPPSPIEGGVAPIPGPYNFPGVDPLGLRAGQIPQGTAPSGPPGPLQSALAGAPPSAPPIDIMAQEKRNYVNVTTGLEATRPKTAGEANLLSKAAKGMFVPDQEGNYHLGGKLLTSDDVKAKYPEVWAKMNAPKAVTAPVKPEAPEGILDKFMHGIADTAHEAGYAVEDIVHDIGKHPEDIPKALILAVPKGVYKMSQMAWGGLGGLTQAAGDWTTYGTEKAGYKDILGKWISEQGKDLRHFTDSKQVNEAMGLGEEGGESPFGRFMSGLASLAPAVGLGKVISVGGFYGATGAGETYGRAEDVQASAREKALAEGKPDPGVSHLSSAAAALIAGATNVLAGQFMPKGLAPEAINPLFREAMPREVARAAISAAQLTAGHNAAKMVYDPEARPKEWGDALGKIFDGYFETLPMLIGAHAASAYAAYKVANTKDFLGRNGEEASGEKTYATALLRAQDPSTTNFVTELIAGAKTPETAEIARQRVRAMFERKDAETPGGFFRGHFDTFFPPITAENWSDWGPQIPGVTAPTREVKPEAEAAKGNAPVATVEPEVAEAPKVAAPKVAAPKVAAPVEAPAPVEATPKPSVQTALKQATKSVEAAKPVTDITPIRIHPTAPVITDTFGKPEHKPDNIVEHSEATSANVASLAAAQSLFGVLAGGIKAGGGSFEGNTEEAKSTREQMHNTVNGLFSSRGAEQVAVHMRQMGVPAPTVGAFNNAVEALKERGIDMNKTGRGKDGAPLSPKQVATRMWEFLNEFHTQLEAQRQIHGVDTPELTIAAATQIGNLIKPGGKYDTAYRKGMGLAEQAPEPHAAVAPIVPTGQGLTPGASGTALLSNEELKRSERGDSYYRVDRSGNVTRLGPQPDAPVRKGEAVVMVNGLNGKPQVQNSMGLGTDKEVLTKLGPKVMAVHEEASRGQAGEGPIGTKGAVKEAPVSGTERPGLQGDVREGQAAGRGANAPTGEPRRLLGKDREAPRSLTPEQEKELDRRASEAEARLAEILGDVSKDMPDEPEWDLQAEDDRGGRTPARGGEYGPSGRAYGPQEMLYPVKRELPDSPYKRVLNLTADAIYSPQFVQALGLKIKSDIPLTGSVILAALDSTKLGLGEERTNELFRSKGFDAIAYTNSAGGATIHGLVEPSRENTNKSGGFVRSSSWNFEAPKHTPATNTGSRGLPPVVVGGKAPPVARGKAEVEAPPLKPEPSAPRPPLTEPIADKIEREQAIEDGMTLVRNNHIKAADLLRLAVQAGVPISDADFKRMMDRDDVESGVGTTRQLAGMDSRPDDSGGVRTFTPGELAHKFVAYAMDGGFADMVSSLWKSRDFKDAIANPRSISTYGRDLFKPLAKSLFDYKSLKDPEAYFKDLVNTNDLGTNERYKLARATLNKLVMYPRSNEATLKSIMDDAAKGEFTKGHADVIALATAANMQFNPDFFHVSEARLGEIQAQDMASGLYEKDYQGSRAPLAGHFETIPDKKDSFSTDDITGNKEVQHQERLATNFGSSAVEHTPSEGRLPFQPVIDKLVSETAARGGLTTDAMEKLGIPVLPKAQHRDAYHAVVNEVRDNPKAMELLNYQGAGILASPGRLPSVLIHNGYAALMLSHLSGNRKKSFHVASDGNPDYYTAGEDIVVKLNGATSDGLPVPDYVMSTNEMTILLDKNHPMYNLTVENVIGRITSDGQIMLAGTPMVRVEQTDAFGKTVSTLQPKDRLTADMHKVREVTGGIPAQLRPGLTASDIIIKDPELVAKNLAKALAGIDAGRTDWAKALGDKLADQFVMANNMLNMAKAVKGGDKTPLLDLDDATMAAVVVASKNADAMGKLKEFADKTKERIDKGGSVAEIAARARAREILAALTKAKNDTPWDSMFDGRTKDGHTTTAPTVVAENAIRNKEQLMTTLEAVGLDRAENKDFYDKINNVSDLFFEDIGANLSTDPDLDSGVWRSLKRVIEIPEKWKGNRSATQIGTTAIHELSHALRTYMGIPMLRTADRWFNSERERYMQSNPRFREVMETPAQTDMYPDPEQTVADIYEKAGTSAKVVLSMEDVANLRSKGERRDLDQHLTLLRDQDGQPYAYSLSRDFTGEAAYRYLNLEEFIAETMKDALLAHAKTISKRRDYDTRDQYILRLGQNGGAKMAMDAIHRSIGHMIDSLIGKSTMRRFVGYLINQGGALERGLAAGGRDVRGNQDVAFPRMDFRASDPFLGGDAMAPGDGARPLGKSPTKTLAALDHKQARAIGFAANLVRSALVRHLNAASVNDKSRSAATIMRQVLGEQGTSYVNMSAAVHEFYDAAHKETIIDKKTLKAMVKLAEDSPEARKCAAEGFAGVSIVKDPASGKDYAVSIDSNGKYDDIMSMDLVRNVSHFQKTGEFTSDLKGLGAAAKRINDITFNRLSSSIANLSHELDSDPENLSDFDESVKKVVNYYLGSYRPRVTPTTLERMTGKRMLGKPSQADQDAERGSQELEGGGLYNTHIDPAFDLGINASMLLEKKFDTLEDAIKAGYFPAHVNAVENVVAGMGNALGVIAQLDALTNLMAKRLAVPGYDGGEETRGWPTLKLSTTGISEKTFGKEIANIRIHPDAARVLDYAFRPDPLARSSIGRSFAMIGGVMNVTQLAGLNDFVNGMTTTAGFAAALKNGKLAPTQSMASRGKMIGGKAALVAGASMAGAAAASAGLPFVAGAGALYLTAKAARALITLSRPMTSGMLNSISEGRKYMGLIQSPDALYPERLPKSQRELLAFAQMTNLKLMETPIQVERMRKMVDQLNRQGHGMQAGAYWITNLFNKPTQWNDIGFGYGSGTIKTPAGTGGKALAKLGMIKMLAPQIMDMFRLPNGEVDFTNPELARMGMELSDDMDNQVGAIQYRNLHMNPTIVSVMKTLFRAFGFRYTTERMKVLAAADMMNNLGNALPWRGHYNALREEATGGGTLPPKPTEPSWEWRDGKLVKTGTPLFAWRAGTIAMANLFLAAHLAGRMQSMVSHVRWPDAGYTMSDFARRANKEVRGFTGSETAGLAAEGYLTFLPPEGSSTSEAIRHLLYNVAGSQFGPSDPTTGLSPQMAVMGTMYQRNLVEHPLDPFKWTLDAQKVAFEKWFQSGLNPPVTLALDMMRGKDTLGRPIGWGAPFNHIGSFNAYNAAMEKRPEDKWYVNVMKAQARNFAHTVSSMMPFFVRDLAEYIPMGGQPAGGAWVKSASQALGGRAMPQDAAMTAAERAAFAIRYTGVNDKQTMESVRMNAAMRPAKVQMSETGQTTLLDSLHSKGLITDEVWKKAKRDYLQAPGVPMPRLLRMLRGIMDKSGDSLMTIYTVALPKEKAQIKMFLMPQHGSGHTKQAEAKKADLRARIAKWDKDNK